MTQVDPDPGTAALELAAHGWSVVPVHTVREGRCSCRRRRCSSPGKHPRVRWDRAMDRAAGPDEIGTWWRRWPDSNVGVVTGWVSGVVVVDVDPRNGGEESLDELEERHGVLPDTVTSNTGGGGRHLWFAHPPHLVPSRPLADGLDLKGQGGLVVAPPSLHTSGDRYLWQPRRGPGDRLPAPLPGWLDRLALSVDDTRPGSDRPPVRRTPTERADFARLWAELGIEIGADEVMVRCPFHDDHHPSLHVDPRGCRWFCFGCRRGGGLGALRRLVPGGSEDAAERSTPPSTEHGLPSLAADITVEVVGESAHQDELLALTGGRRTWSGAHVRTLARLEAEEDNPFDPEAVLVTIDGRPVGHLPRLAARAYRPLVEELEGTAEGATCEAEIRGGWERGHGDVGQFGVVVRLPGKTSS